MSLLKLYLNYKKLFTTSALIPSASSWEVTVSRLRRLENPEEKENNLRIYYDKCEVGIENLSWGSVIGIKENLAEWWHMVITRDVPRSTSYGNYISQRICFARASSYVTDFNTCTL